MECNNGKRSLAVLCVLLLAGLSACTSGESVVTSDNLNPSSNAQVALEQQAGGGQTYQYVWMAQDPDATIEEYRATYTQQLEKMIQEANSDDSATRQIYEEAMEEELEYYRKVLEQERMLEPVISAQEAANVAGRILEEDYGIDLEQRILYLSCAKANVNHSDRLQWNVHLYEDADEILLSSAEASIVLDATTGEIVTAEYLPSYDEYQAMLENLPSCYEAAKDPDTSGSYGSYKVDDPSFEEFKKNVSEQIRTALEQSAMTAGASVDTVETSTVDGALKNEYLTVSIHYNNGSTAYLTALRPYTCTGDFPLRWFQYGNTSYNKA